MPHAAQSRSRCVIGSRLRLGGDESSAPFVRFEVDSIKVRVRWPDSSLRFVSVGMQLSSWAGRLALCVVCVLSAAACGSNRDASGSSSVPASDGVVDGRYGAGLGCSLASDGAQVVIAYAGPWVTGNSSVHSIDDGATWH